MPARNVIAIDIGEGADSIATRRHIHVPAAGLHRDPASDPGYGHLGDVSAAAGYPGFGSVPAL